MGEDGMKTTAAVTAGIIFGCLLTWGVMDHRATKAAPFVVAPAVGIKGVPSGVDEYQVLSYNGTKEEYVFLHKNPPLSDVKTTVRCVDRKHNCDDYFTVGETLKTVSFTDSADGADGWVVEHMGGSLLKFMQGVSLPPGSPDHAIVTFVIEREENVSRGSQ
jgi:hypothetical protein